MNYAQNIGNNVNGYYQQSSTLQKVIGFAVLIVVFYFIYVMFIKSYDKTQLTKKIAGNITKIIPSNKIPQASISDYTISVWLFIAQWNYGYGKDKHVLGRYYSSTSEGNVTHNPAPAIILDKYTNDIIVKVSYKDPSGGLDKIKECRVKGVPLQKWTSIIISVNNRTLDIYLDGKLTRTCIIPGVPTIGGSPDSDLVLGPAKKNGYEMGFGGDLTDVTTYRRAINPTQAYNLYRKGNSENGIGSMVGRYKFKFSLMDNNKETSNFVFPK